MTESHTEFIARMARERIEFEAEVKAGKYPRYAPCSGQSKGPRSWSVHDQLIPWWRPVNSRGRVRLFSSQATAQKLADKLNEGIRV